MPSGDVAFSPACSCKGNDRYASVQVHLGEMKGEDVLPQLERDVLHAELSKHFIFNLIINGFSGCKMKYKVIQNNTGLT